MEAARWQVCLPIRLLVRKRAFSCKSGCCCCSQLKANLNEFKRQRESVDKLAGRSISRESVVPDNWRVFAHTGKLLKGVLKEQQGQRREQQQLRQRQKRHQLSRPF